MERHTAVMLTLCATIPEDPTTVHAKMDSMEMAKIALVTTSGDCFMKKWAHR